MRTNALAAAVLAVVTAVAVVLSTVADDDPLLSRIPDLAHALGMVPADTLDASFTDWASVRDTLGASDVSSAADSTSREQFLGAAFDADLSALSTLVGSEEAMTTTFGWSVLDLKWEMFGQSRAGQVVVAALGSAVDPASVTSGLQDLGYTAPTPEQDGGVWLGGVDLVAGIDASLTPALAHVAVLGDERLVVLSDTVEYVQRTVEVIRGSLESLADDGAAAAAAVPLYGDLAAVVHAPGIACAVSGYARADGRDRALALRLSRAVGGLRAYDALGVGLQPGGRPAVMRVVMTYDSARAAAADLEARTALARGPAVGQGGDFAERFELSEATLHGTSVVLTLMPVDDGTRLLSDLGTGPLLFAWCGASETETV